MVKRARREDDVDEQRLTKRARLSSLDRLSKLSDELILRVLSYLPVSQLVICQRLSSKYFTLAGDGQLWKSHYYDRFVRPRASRLPGLRNVHEPEGKLHFASKASKWLDDEYLVKKGGSTNWKSQYKLRHNWSKGNCSVNEIETAEESKIPPVLVQMHDGVIYMADQTDGLRAWSAKGKRSMVAQKDFEQDYGHPTALTVDVQPESSQQANLLVGFENGAFSLYSLDKNQDRFVHRYSHKPSSSGVISAVALTYPYAITMTATHQLSLYAFQQSKAHQDMTILGSPRLLHSLKSSTVWPPLTIALRVSQSNIVVSIAYALPTYLSGWTVGIQEIRIASDGRLLGSRLASAIDQHYRPLAFSSRPIFHHLPAPPVGSLATSTATEMRHIHSKPTSLSYSHPYLLVSHPDNTLTLYLVTSTTESLHVGSGSRLWGHTSAVSGAHVADRGKAVSVSRRGDELRVWELEGGFISAAAKRRLATGELSVQIQPCKLQREETSQAGLDLVTHGSSEDSLNDDSLTLTRGWIGFDDENVVVLKEQGQGRQALVVYDFT